MLESTQTLGSFAGATGVGALCFLAVFLFLDGCARSLFPAVEIYAKSTTWGIVAAVPVLAIAYVAGLLAISAAQFTVAHTFGPARDVEFADLVQLSNSRTTDSVALREYTQLREERAILAGSALALLMLAIGAVSESRNLPGLKAVVLVSAFLTVFVAAGAFYAAGGKSVSAHNLAKTFSNLNGQAP
jgi:hypothetical protein